MTPKRRKWSWVPCKWCGKDFQLDNGNRRYCGDECSRASYRATREAFNARRRKPGANYHRRHWFSDRWIIELCEESFLSIGQIADLLGVSKQVPVRVIREYFKEGFYKHRRSAIERRSQRGKNDPIHLPAVPGAEDRLPNARAVAAEAS